MKVNPVLLAGGLFLCLVLGCNLGKNKNSNVSTNSGSASNSSSSHSASTGDLISEIHMAKDDGSGAPGDEATVFTPGDRTIHCVVTLKDTKSGTRMKFSWWIVDADGAKNEKIKDIDYTTRSLENVVHGHLTLPSNWPKGKYKVEVYVNDNLDKTVFYEVE
jgi:hypothetical protein